MMTLVFMILFLISAVFTMFIAWRFNEKVENFFRHLSIIFAIATAVAFIGEIIHYII
jgi:hypothetical protein